MATSTLLRAVFPDSPSPTARCRTSGSSSIARRAIEWQSPASWPPSMRAELTRQPEQPHSASAHAAILAGVAALLAVSGCTPHRPPEDTPRTAQPETSRAVPPLARREIVPGVVWWVTLSDSTVQLGRPVELRAIMRNTTAAATQVEMPWSRELGVDLVVADAQGGVVWHRNHGFESDLMGGPLHIAAADSLVWSAVWTQRDTLGRPVRPGEFWVRAVRWHRFPADSGTGSVRLAVQR
jgi:hypothetical protein